MNEKPTCTKIWIQLCRFFLEVVLDCWLIPQVLYFGTVLIYKYLGTTSSAEDVDFALSLMSWVIVIASPLFSFSFQRLGAIHFNTEMRRDFHSREMTKKEAVRQIFSWEYYIPTGMLLLFFAVLPLSWTFAALGYIIPNKVLGKACLIAMLALTGWLGVRSAQKYWAEHTEEKHYTKKECDRQFSVAAAAYTGAPILIVFVGPYVWAVLMLIVNTVFLKITYFLIALFICFCVYRLARALFKRRSCIRRIQSICAEKGYTLSEIERPYMSVFTPRGGVSFKVTVHDEYDETVEPRTYACKLIGSVRKNLPVSVYASGVIVYHHEFRFAKSKVFEYQHKVKFGFESEHRKLIVVSPIPKHIWTFHGSLASLIDNGDEVGEYKFYSATAFARA